MENVIILFELIVKEGKMKKVLQSRMHLLIQIIF